VTPEVGSERSDVRAEKLGGRGFAFATLFVFVAALALPVFAHGCHAGDHDDEPLFIPTEKRSEVGHPGPTSDF
jgi:hypothetical protein